LKHFIFYWLLLITCSTQCAIFFTLTVCTFVCFLIIVIFVCFSFRHGLHPLEIRKKIEAARDELNATMLDADGTLRKSPSLKKLDKLVEEDKINIEAYRTRADNHLNSNATKQALANFVKELLANLKQRFPDFGNDSVFGRAKVFLPENFPTIAADVVEYGEESIEGLADFYALDKDNVCDEWRNFKYEVMSNLCPDDEWRKVLVIAAKRSDDWPNLAHVAHALLAFNAENATVERGFSLLSRLRTPTRNRLFALTADKLIRLRLNAASYKQYNYDRSYEHWLKSSKRSRYHVSDSSVTDEAQTMLNSLLIDLA